MEAREGRWLLAKRKKEKEKDGGLFAKINDELWALGNWRGATGGNFSASPLKP